MIKIKAVVLVPFKDSESKKTYKVGDVIEIATKRFNEIIAKGRYIQLAEDEPKVTATKT